MDNDFVNNLSNMLKNGNVPNDMQNLINNLKSSNCNNTNSNIESNSVNNDNNSNTINPDMLKNIMNMFNNNANSSNEPNNPSNSDNFSNVSNGSSNIDINTLIKIKSIMEKMNESKNDPRSNLLHSLKPYLKKSRQDKVEQYVQLFSVGKIINAFNQNGGENAK